VVDLPAGFSRSDFCLGSFNTNDNSWSCEPNALSEGSGGMFCATTTHMSDNFAIVLGVPGTGGPSVVPPPPSTTSTGPPDPNIGVGGGPTGGLTTGEIVGILIGSILGAVLLIGVIVVLASPNIREKVF